MIQQNVSAVKNQAIHFIDKINVMVDYNETFEQHFQIKKSVTINIWGIRSRDSGDMGILPLVAFPQIFIVS